MESGAIVSLHWFRKGLRLHDNPALLEAAKHATKVYPVFCIDPFFAKPDIVGVNRYNFLLESLEDLDASLRKLGSRLFILNGKPDEQLLAAVQRWGINQVTFESDTEPYAKVRDASVSQQLQSMNCKVVSFPTHTLRDLDQYKAMSKGSIPTTYQSFGKLFSSCGSVRQALPAPTVLPAISSTEANDAHYNIPTLAEMGYTEPARTHFKGGETEALKRLQALVIDRPAWVNKFAKPETAPNSLEPSTTVLSPYLKFGCLSPALFYDEVEKCNKKATGGAPTQPPVSLHGQLLWREFFYLCSFTTKNFDKMIGNDHVRQIPWERNQEKILAWKEARSGFPFIDAIMTQLREEGWIHHLARHAVACFLTRGDLWQHWEEGVRVFDLYLLDDDWALNNANWQWLSCSNFFYQYYRCYSPIAFGKKTDKEGLYIKKYLPQLANMPAKYIFEPWTAPLAVQRQAGCIIGTDYPFPIVEHDKVSKENMEKMKAAYALHNSGGGSGGGVDDNEDDTGGSSSLSKKRVSSSSSSSNKKSKKD